MIILMLSTLLLTACADCVKPNNYAEGYKEMANKAKQHCESKKMVYGIVYTDDLQGWKTMCYTTSPMKTYTFPLQ